MAESPTIGHNRSTSIFANQSSLAPIIMNNEQMYLTTAADGHVMLVMENCGFWTLLKVRGLLRFRYGFRRRGKTIVGFGEAIYPDFVRGGIVIEAGQNDMVGSTLHASNEASDAFLRKFSQSLGINRARLD